MAVKRIGHIGIAAQNGAEMADFFVNNLGGKIDSRTEYPEMKQISTMVGIGDCQLEIMEPLGDDGVIAKYLVKKGPGLHHISLEVKDIVSLVSELEEKGIQIISKSLESDEVRFAFISPKSSGGVLIEMYEYL